MSSPNSKLIVVALGGNAISQPNEEGNVKQQFDNSARTAVQLADLIEMGHQLVITHGNGPQIGNFLLRNEVARSQIYPLPMQVAVAHVQGGMGYMLAQTLTNELDRRGRNQRAAAIVTTVRVDALDPAFENPTKPVGRTFTGDQAGRYRGEEDWVIKEVSPGKYRRVVPSPIPQEILEIKVIQRLVDAGELVVVCGGGGVPVVRDPQRGFHGVRAVIDKDLASSILAAQLNADMLMILTNVDKVAINYGKPDQRDVDRMSVDQARQWLTEGQFGAGSMGPKVQGAVDFLTQADKPDATAVIGHLDHACECLTGGRGTRITRGE